MFKGIGRSGGKGAMAAGALAAALLALGAWIGSKRDLSGPEGDTSKAALPAPQTPSAPVTLAENAVQGVSIGPEGTAATEPELQAEAPQTKTAEGPSEAPAFDEVRREADGMTVIAGRAAPGSRVAVLKDGEEIASATADGSGKFATLAMIPPDGAGHVLTLLGQDGDQKITSDEEIILAPVAAPVAQDQPLEMAQADTNPQASPLAETAAASDPAGDELEPTEQAEVDAEQDVTSNDATPLAGTATKPPAESGADSAQAPAPSQEASPETADAAPARDSIAAAETTDADGPAADATPLAGTGTANATEADIPVAAATSPAETGASNEVAKSGAAEMAEAEPADGEAQSVETATAPDQAPPSVDTAAAEGSSAASPATPLAGTATSEAEAEPDSPKPAPSAPEVAASTPAQPAPAAPKTADVAPTVRPAAEVPAEEITAQSDTPNTENAPEKPPAPAPATAPVAVLKSTAEGVERIDTAPPQVMTNVALDTIGYSDQGDVQLAGRAQPKTREVRVYLDNDAVISLPVDQEGRWRGDLPNVDEGVYTLRVDELSAGGEVTSRVETPFKRESQETLAAASAGLTGPLGVVTVQKGDTLWAISRTRYGDPLLYVKVFEANSGAIRDPDLIYPGQVFDLPDTGPSE